MMSNPVIVKVFDIVGGPLCVSAGVGQRVYDKIAPLLHDGQNMVLSFAQIEMLIGAFLNAAVGQLYGEFPPDCIRELVSVRNLGDEDMTILKCVVENAKTYFKAPQSRLTKRGKRMAPRSWRETYKQGRPLTFGTEKPSMNVMVRFERGRDDAVHRDVAPAG